jgi:hypothetical protein
MNPPSIAYTDPIPRGSVRQRLDNLEAQMWDRARRNLILLYNGAQFAGTPPQAAAPTRLVGPLAVLNRDV